MQPIGYGENWALCSSRLRRTVVPRWVILIFPTETIGVAELAYAVGAAHQGRDLAHRAVISVLSLAAAAGIGCARLLISPDNTASEHVARASAFVLAEKPTVERRRKGRTIRLATWERSV